MIGALRVNIGQYLVHSERRTADISTLNFEVRAFRGKFDPPPLDQKLKVAFHQFHPIGLLEEWSKYKNLACILLFSVAMVIKMADKMA